MPFYALPRLTPLQVHFAKRAHDGEENIDEPELAFQLAGYTTLLLLCSLQLVFGSAQGQVRAAHWIGGRLTQGQTGVSVTLNAATVSITIICLLLRVLSNLKSVAVYCQGLVVHFCPLFIQVFATTFCSFTVALLTINNIGSFPPSALRNQLTFRL